MENLFLEKKVDTFFVFLMVSLILTLIYGLYVIGIHHNDEIEMENFYQFNSVESINRPAMIQLSDRYLDQQYKESRIYTPPYEGRVCK